MELVFKEEEEEEEKKEVMLRERAKAKAFTKIPTTCAAHLFCAAHLLKINCVV
jgi:hypothetical protein